MSQVSSTGSRVSVPDLGVYDPNQQDSDSAEEIASHTDLSERSDDDESFLDLSTLLATPTTPIEIEGVHYLLYAQPLKCLVDNYLYYAIVGGLCLCRQKGESLMPIEEEILSADNAPLELRSQCANWIRSNKDREDYKIFLTDEIAHYMRFVKRFDGEESCNFDLLVEVYCSAIESTDFSGDNNILFFLSEMCSRQIHLHNTSDSTTPPSEVFGMRYNSRSTIHICLSGDSYVKIYELLEIQPSQ